MKVKVKIKRRNRQATGKENRDSDLQLAAMAASPAVLNPSQETRDRTLKFLKVRAISSRQSSETTIRLRRSSSRSGHPSAIDWIHAPAPPPQSAGTRLKSAKCGFPLMVAALTSGNRRTATAGATA